MSHFEFKGRRYRLQTTRPFGNCLIESLLVQLSRHFKNIDSSEEACNEVRKTIVEWLQIKLEGCNNLLSTLNEHRRDREKYAIGSTPRENAEEELKYLLLPTSWGGVEFIDAFSAIYCVRVKILMARGWSFDVGEIGEQLIIHYDEIGHYSGVANFEPADERKKISRAKTNTPVEPDVNRERVRDCRKRKAEEIEASESIKPQKANKKD